MSLRTNLTVDGSPPVGKAVGKAAGKAVGKAVGKPSCGVATNQGSGTRSGWMEATNQEWKT